MPVVYPQVRGLEALVPRRIQAKYEAYRSRLVDDPNPGGNMSYVGERFEIAVAAEMYRRGRLTHGQQISRWSSRNEVASQSVTLGAQIEYDFVIPSTQRFAKFTPVMQVQGAILGEAKSNARALGGYIKKAATYCLHDPTGLAGYCFVTPQIQATFWRTLVANTYAMLADPDESAGIAGGPGWKNRAAVAGKPAGAAIIAHFAKYRSPNPAVPANLSPTAINTELAQFAGFVIVCYQVQLLPDDQLAGHLRGL
jgi:hypothetical protein